MHRIVDSRDVGRAWREAGTAGPPVDLYETADAVVIRVAIPGADGSSLSLNIGEESVTVRGESPPPGARWGERTAVHWQEIPYGRFERMVPLPVPVDARRTRAQFRNGLLDITLPKSRGAEAREIPITFA